MDKTKAIEGLEAYLAFCKANPEFPITERRMFVYACSREDFVRYAKMLGKFEKNADNDYLSLSRYFGPIEVFLYTSHETCCEKIVTLEEVPEQVLPARPETIVPATVKEVVRWKCPESILALEEKVPVEA